MAAAEDNKDRTERHARSEGHVDVPQRATLDAGVEGGVETADVSQLVALVEGQPLTARQRERMIELGYLKEASLPRPRGHER